MNTTIIDLQHFTKDYGGGKGAFDVSLNIAEGEVYGYLGPNGAGKTTTIRHLMGFSKADRGTVRIDGLDCWTKQKEIQRKVGYIPGEIYLPSDTTGIKYLKLIARMRNMKDISYAKKLLDLFKLDPKFPIKKMSKGMKQKIAIVCAFMHDPDILLLDEPTSGLDPIMQKNLLDLVADAKRRRKTVLLSSHRFEEVEKACDRVGMIKDGKLIKELTIDELRHNPLKIYKIEFENKEDLVYFTNKYPESKCDYDKNQVMLSVKDEDINEFISALAGHRVRFMTEIKRTLEEYFMQFYTE